MRRLACVFTIVAVASCNRGAIAPDPTPQTDGLTVHEWGTYTSVQGSNGATLDGMQHEEEALPAFVAQRAATSNHEKGFEALPEAVNQKLETPVLYFYTASPMIVRATVDFPGGIISQWFPQASSYAPEIGGFDFS